MAGQRSVCPSLIKEIMFGISLGLLAGGLWKMRHWNNQRRTREFYDLLEKGEISVFCRSSPPTAPESSIFVLPFAIQICTCPEFNCSSCSKRRMNSDHQSGLPKQNPKA